MNESIKIEADELMYVCTMITETALRNFLIFFFEFLFRFLITQSRRRERERERERMVLSSLDKWQIFWIFVNFYIHFGWEMSLLFYFDYLQWPGGWSPNNAFVNAFDSYAFVCFAVGYP
jgi:hypothetical protein